MLSRLETKQIEERQRFSMAMVIVFLMLTSSLLAFVQAINDGEEPTTQTRLVEGDTIGQSLAQSTYQAGQGSWTGAQDGVDALAHEALSNICLLYTSPSPRDS